MDQQINIDLSKTQEITCQQCDSNLFEEVLMLRRVSRFVAGTAQDGIIPINIMACKKCGEILNETMPMQLRKSEEEKKKSSIQISE